MENFWDHENEILPKIKRSSHVLLGLDFDGTLVSIEKHPAQVKLISKNKAILEKLSTIPNIDIVILSGRSLQDLKKYISLPHAMLAGNHGFEWEKDGHKKDESLPKSLKSNLRKILQNLKNIKVKGFLIEDKLLSISCHYRNVPQKEVSKVKKEIYKILHPYLKEKIVELIPGKKVIDIRPKRNWTKGHFLENYIQSFKNMYDLLVIYIGDDTTDEDVFSKLSNGLTIRVGKKKGSRAKYYLKSWRQTYTLLSRLL